MRYRLLFFFLFFLLAGLFLPHPAQAKSDFMDVLTAAYPSGAGPLGDRSCANCHVSDSDYGLNPYGKQVAHELVTANTKTLTPELLKKIEGEDADQDGVPNGDELRAGTGPGDPKSGAKPGVTPPPPTAEPSAPPPANPLFPKTAYHPAIVHLPIGLFIAGLLFDFLGLRRKQTTLLMAGWYNLVLAALTGIAGIVSGLLATFLKHIPLKPGGVIFNHMALAIVSTVLMWLMVAQRVHRHEKMNVQARVIYYLLAFACLVIISYSGHLGGVFTGTDK